MKENLSIRILMQHKGVRFVNICPDLMSSRTLTTILNADQRVTPKSLKKVGKLLDADRYIHFVYALDRLYREHPCAQIISEHYRFPEFVPSDVKDLLTSQHPIFIQAHQK